MKRTKKGKLNSVYIFFLVRVLPILIVPVVVMAAVYCWSIEVINQQTYEKNLAVMKSSAETIKKTFDNMDSLITYINGSPSINRLFSTVNPVHDGSTTSELLDIQRELRALTTANDLLDNIQIFSMKNNILIDSVTNALFIDRYYTSNFMINNMSFSYWYQHFLLESHNYDIYPGLEVKVGPQIQKKILYAKSLPLTETREISGGVYFFLDEEYLLNLFSIIPYQNSGFIYVLGKNGDPILYKNGSDMNNPIADSKYFSDQSGYFHQKIDEKNMFITYFKDKSRDLVYVAALPQEQVLEPTYHIRLYIGILIFLSLIASGILLFLSVAKLSKPIENICNLISKGKSAISYEEFEFEISRLVKNNKEMQADLNRQIPELKTSIFYNLLIGRFQTVNEIRENLMKININLDAQYYVVLIASINDLNTSNNLEEISARKVYINNILSQSFDNVEGIYNLDFERTVLLLSYNQLSYIDVMSHVEKNTECIVEQLFISVKVSISFSGDIARNIIDIPASFFNANTAMNYREKNPSYTVQWYNKAERIDKLNYYYPIELETKLIAMVNAGNTASLTEIFDKLDRRNKYIIGTDNNKQFLALLQSMNATLVRVFNNDFNDSQQTVKIKDKISEQLQTHEDLLQTYYLIKELFMVIASNSNEAIRKKDSSLINQIQQFIEEKYTDPQLSLTLIANVFGITEAYLSSLFKQKTGENFSKYVESLRMKKAREYIKKEEFLINEIAEMVGYNSPQVFRRAYKRYYGSTPTGIEKADK